MQPCPCVSVSSVAAFVLQQRIWIAVPEPCHPHSLTYLPALHRKHLLTPALCYFYVKPLRPRYVLLICLSLHMVVKHRTLCEISPEFNVLWYLSSAWMCDMFWFTPSSSPRPPLPTLRTEGGSQVSNWGWDHGHRLREAGGLSPQLIRSFPRVRGKLFFLWVFNISFPFSSSQPTDHIEWWVLV